MYIKILDKDVEMWYNLKIMEKSSNRLCLVSFYPSTYLVSVERVEEYSAASTPNQKLWKFKLQTIHLIIHDLNIFDEADVELIIKLHDFMDHRRYLT